MVDFLLRRPLRCGACTAKGVSFEINLQMSETNTHMSAFRVTYPADGGRLLYFLKHKHKSSTLWRAEGAQKLPRSSRPEPHVFLHAGNAKMERMRCLPHRKNFIPLTKLSLYQTPKMKRRSKKISQETGGGSYQLKQLHFRSSRCSGTLRSKDFKGRLEEEKLGNSFTSIYYNH